MVIWRDTSGLDRFMEWKTKDGDYENIAFATFDTFYEGMFQKERLLDIIKNFILFSRDGKQSFKILAGYHQLRRDGFSRFRLMPSNPGMCCNH